MPNRVRWLRELACVALVTALLIARDPSRLHDVPAESVTAPAPSEDAQPGLEAGRSAIVPKSDGRPSTKSKARIRLVQPNDTAQKLSRPAAVLNPPVTFTWATVPGATRYTYELTRGQVGSQEGVVTGETDGTTWTSGLDPSLPKEDYRFRVVAHGPSGDTMATLLVTTAEPNGAIGMSEWYEFRVAGGDPQPGVGRIEIVPTYDGVPLDRDLNVPVKASVYREEDRQPREVTARLVGGVIAFDGLATGIYHVNVRFEWVALGASLGLPTSWLMSDDQSRLALLTNGQTLRREVALIAPIDLREPAAIGRPSGSKKDVVLTSPVTLAWNPVPGAKGYSIEVNLFGGSTIPEQRTFDVTETRWTIDLPPTEPKATYLILLSAKGKKRTIAKTLAHFEIGDRASNDGSPPGT